MALAGLIEIASTLRAIPLVLAPLSGHVLRKRAREALTDAQQRLRPNPESCRRAVAA